MKVEPEDHCCMTIATAVTVFEYHLGCDASRLCDVPYLLLPAAFCCVHLFLCLTMPFWQPVVAFFGGSLFGLRHCLLLYDKRVCTTQWYSTIQQHA